MFVAVILICGLPEGNMGCQAISGRVPWNTYEECIATLGNDLPIVHGTLPPGAKIIDADCLGLSLAS